MMLAATHYSWKTGSLEGFEKCFFYHKSEVIHLVNTRFPQGTTKLSIDVLKAIAMLSIAEVCAPLRTWATSMASPVLTESTQSTVGNYPMAEVHLRGLLLILQAREAQGLAEQRRDDEVLDPLILA